MEKPEFRQKIYFAAALFNTKECLFNVHLTRKLEQLGHSVYLPQRDGFEFSQITQMMTDPHATEEEKSKAISTIIYLADLNQIYNSSVLIANLDEPHDPGVLIEVMYAKAFGIPIIGYRCDSRSPYGAPGTWYQGCHFFPIYQCDYMIQVPNVSCDSPENADGLISQIASQLHEQMGKRKKTPLPLDQKTTLTVQLAEELIPKGVEKPNQINIPDLVKSFITMKDKLKDIEPECMGLQTKSDKIVELP